MATTLETAAAQYAEALDGEQEARHRAWVARNAVESCTDALERAEDALRSAAAPEED